MTIDGLVQDMVDTAANYPGVDLVLYRTAVETTTTIVSTVIGIIAVALAIGIPIILSIELLIINFPPLAVALMDREEYHREAGVEKRNRNWGLFVNDARKALKISAEKQESVNMSYIRVKWVTLCTAGISIAVLFAGQDYIVGIVTKVLRPILLRIAMV